MNDNILMLMRELDKTDFYDGDYHVYVEKLSNLLLSRELETKTIKNIVYFFECVFFKNSDYTITTDFKKHSTKKKYVDFIENFDVIMSSVVSLGDKYNWPRRD